jgi:hypothetical protein
VFVDTFDRHSAFVSFLDLMTSSPSSLVPTIDIDLAWHTHQLKAGVYNADCMNLLGRTIDQYVS